MRKGKVYSYLQPTCLAPDMFGWGGLPRYATSTLTLAIAGQITQFASTLDDMFVEVIPGTWEVRYHFKGKSGVFTCDWTLKVFPSPNEPGVRILFGGILDDGSDFLAEGQWVWDPLNGLTFGIIRGLPPFKAIALDGVITNVLGFEVVYVPRKDVH